MSVAYTCRKRSICRFSYSSLFIFTFLAFALIFFPPGIASAAQVTLAWDENSEPDLAGYRVFCRQVGQDYDFNNPAWEGTQTTCEIYDLDDNPMYYFVVRAYDFSGNESGNSNEVVYFELPPEGGTNPGDGCGSGMVYDCVGNCVDEAKAESWIGDGYCDDGTWGMDLRCDAFDNDGGDCGDGDPGDPCSPGKVYDCVGNCVDQATAQAYIADGYCDDGTWGFDLRCDAFDNDGGDCETGNPGEPCGPGKVYDCVGNCVDQATAQAYIADGYCDDGTWGFDLRCDAFDNDGGDCD